MIKIKNYTTTINWKRTISEIEELLSAVGASHIMKSYYGDGRLEALCFTVENVGYKLPANSDKVKVVLADAGLRHKDFDNHCENVAWRVIKDWLHAQLSLIQVGQAELKQIMLPYAWDARSNKTLYEMYQEGKFNKLLNYETVAEVSKS